MGLWPAVILVATSEAFNTAVAAILKYATNADCGVSIRPLYLARRSCLTHCTPAVQLRLFSNDIRHFDCATFLLAYNLEYAYITAYVGQFICNTGVEYAGRNSREVFVAGNHIVLFAVVDIVHLFVTLLVAVLDVILGAVLDIVHIAMISLVALWGQRRPWRDVEH